ncbi:hypothetical protein SAMN05216359_107229 [Roseateles sp. YR242]|uniref:hypothetical protein n=1 Tax=Roseateles sp. YR242 TaxID=1855305 RepID=UPI0008B6F6FD|nr:hypothetical protein [Roseateles sp. YR242]SEL32586.1 hypothetical protein SAMN05216359_107229 [Roseateles sp. YR242]
MKCDIERFGWRQTFVVVSLIMMTAGGARAQQVPTLAATEAAASDEKELASCLRMPLRKPEKPLPSPTQEPPGQLRVNMRFTSPELPPETEVDNSSARDDVRDLVLKYVANYRLPCLKPGGEYQTSQVFDFGDAQRPTLFTAALCVVPPAQPFDMGELTPSRRRNILLRLTFAGGGQQPPSIQVNYSSASPALQAALVAWAAGYRMPCRNAGDSVAIFEQAFSLAPADDTAEPTFGLTTLSLSDFLKQTDHPERLRASFDFNTMGCPFIVRFMNQRPVRPNMASAGDPEDPRRINLVRWLAGLRLAVEPPQEPDELFGTTFQINVPCGQLELTGAPLARNTPSGDLFKSAQVQSTDRPDKQAPSHD